MDRAASSEPLPPPTQQIQQIRLADPQAVVPERTMPLQSWPQPAAPQPAPSPTVPPAPPGQVAPPGFPPQGYPPQGFPPHGFQPGPSYAPPAMPMPHAAQYAGFQPNQQPNYPYPAYPLYGPPPYPLVPAPPPKPPKGPRSRRAVVIGSVTLTLAVLATAGGLDIARSATAAEGGKPSKGAAATDDGRRALWRTVPASTLLPTSLSDNGGLNYSRVGLDADESCAALPAAFITALSPAKCTRDIQATYIDQTQTVTATVGIVVLTGSNATRLQVASSWSGTQNAVNYAMMPSTYAAPNTIASGFGDPQRIAWGSQTTTDGTYLVYTVTGFTDDRTGPDASTFAAQSASDLQQSSPPVQTAGQLPISVEDLIMTEEQKRGED
ncbi:MAG TPA: hypothetical protein VGM10_04505 [Actinocrinis sp.]